MIEVTKIQNGLFGLVGLRQPLDPSLPTLDASITSSESNLFVDDVPPFKLKLFLDTQDYAGIDATQLNALLEQTQKTAIANVMYKCFDQADYIDQNYLFSRASTRTNIEDTLTGYIYGYKIQVSDTKNVAFKIGKCQLEYSFDNATIDVEIVLMNSFLPDPIHTKAVTLTSKAQIVDLNFTINNTNDDYKGDYYLMIYPVNPTDRLEPFKRDYEDGNFMNHLSELTVEQCYFAQNDWSITDFTVENEYTISQNVGMNPQFFVYEDFTEFVIASKSLFSRAIQLEWAIYLLMQIATSTRSNRDERLGREIVAMILLSINGNNAEGQVNMRGLRDALYFEIKSLKKEIQKLKDSFFTDQFTVDIVE